MGIRSGMRRKKHERAVFCFLEARLDIDEEEKLFS